jgi:hypothetical protein
VPGFSAPTEYFGLRVGLTDRPGAPGAKDRAFALWLENRTPDPWSGRIPVVWAQSGVSWTEVFDLDLAAGERRSVDLATRWVPGSPSLEGRLASERSPEELRRLPSGETERWALTSRYVPLGSVGDPPSVPPMTPAEDRRDRIRQTVWLVVAAVIAVVSAILLVVYASSIV